MVCSRVSGKWKLAKPAQPPLSPGEIVTTGALTLVESFRRSIETPNVRISREVFDQHFDEDPDPGRFR